MRKLFLLLSLFLVFSAFHPRVGAQWKTTRFPGSTVPPYTLGSLTWKSGALYVSRDTVLYRSTDNGDSWKEFASWTYEFILTGTDSILIIIASIPFRIPIGGMVAFHVIRSTDDGSSWRDTTTLRGGWYPSWKGVTTISERIFISHSDTRNSVIHFSSDGGFSWDSTKSEGLPDGFPRRLISKGSLLFLALDNYALENSLFKSSDYGESWEPVWSDSSGGYPELLLVVGNTLLATMSDYGGGNLRTVTSTDDGQTWSVRPYAPGLMWSHDGVLFCNPMQMQPGHLMVSPDIGNTWRPWNEGIPDPEGTYIYSMAFSDSFAYASTSSTIWRRPLSEIVTSTNNISASLPIGFRLHQNYPNPFNPTTTIKYELPRASHVTLTVYDVLGREVAVLVNGRRDAGVHEVKFDGSNLASGVYFYRLQAGDFISVKKMLVLK